MICQERKNNRSGDLVIAKKLKMCYDANMEQSSNGMCFPHSVEDPDYVKQTG